MENNLTFNDYIKAIDTIAKIEKMRDAYSVINEEYEKELHTEAGDMVKFLDLMDKEKAAHSKLFKAMRTFHRTYEAFDTYYLPAQMKANYDLWLEDIYASIARNITEAFSQYMKSYCFTR